MPSEQNPEFEAFFVKAEEFTDLMSAQVIARDEALSQVNDLEAAGTPFLTDPNLRELTATNIQHAYTMLAEAEVEPPLDDQQIAAIAGKVLLFTTLLDAMTPAKGKKRGPTPTKDLPTDKPKG